MNRQSLSRQFCKDIQEHCVIVSCGSKGSGKTSFMLAILRACLESENSPYEEYWLVLPSFYVEADEAYEWLKEYKNVTIFTSYHKSIGEKLYKQNQDQKKRTSTLFVIDDASTFAKELHSSHSKEIVGLASENRHIKVTTWILLHSLRGLLSPVLRENIRLLILYSITNRKLLESIYEEYLSLYYDNFNAFVKEYVEDSKKPYNSWCLRTVSKDIPRPIIDVNSNDWKWVQKCRKMNSNKKSK